MAEAVQALRRKLEAELARHQQAVEAENVEHSSRVLALLGQMATALEKERNTRPAVDPGKIRLDVGGTVYSVTLEMLQRYPGSRLGRLFAPGWEASVGRDGSVFINRDPKLFRYVADFLRGNSIGALQESKQRALLIEAE